MRYLDRFRDSVFTLRIAAILPLALAAAGCQFGKKEVVFVTNTSIGVDLDAKTPTVSIGYNRFEGVLQPQFEQGQTLPVLSSINADVRVAAFGAGHSFATGTPAVIFGELFTKNEDYFSEADVATRDKLRPGNVQFSAPTTTPADHLDVPADGIATLLAADDRRRVIFTTSTKLALDVEFEAGAGGAPTAINLGYKRKEFAYAPLLERVVPVGTDQYRLISLPALLATAGARSRVAESFNVRDPAQVQISQTFATGAAATYLASHPGVRAALGPVLIEDYAAAAQYEAAVKNYGVSKTSQEQSYKEIQTNYPKITDPAARIAIFNAALNQFKVLDADAASVPDDKKGDMFLTYVNMKFGNEAHRAGLEKLNELIKSKLPAPNP